MEKNEKRRKGRWGVNQHSRKRDHICGWCVYDVGNPTNLLKWVEEVPADEILAHRIVWAFVFMLIVLGVTKRFRQFIGEFVNLLNDLNY